MSTENQTATTSLTRWRNSIPVGDLVWYLRGSFDLVPLRIVRRWESVNGISYECKELSNNGGGGIRHADELLPNNITEALADAGCPRALALAP